MGQVIDFPKKDEWNEAIKELKAILRRAGSSDEAAEWIMTDMRSRLEKIEQPSPLSLSFGLNHSQHEEIGTKLSELVEHVSSQYLVQIVALEHVLYLALYGDK